MSIWDNVKICEQHGEPYTKKCSYCEVNRIADNLRWLVDHSVAAGSISKVKGAELLGIPLIDYVNENLQENE